MCSEKSQEQRDWCERQKMARWCVTASFFVFGFVLYRHCRLRCSCFIMIDAWVCVWVVVECMLAGLLPVALLFKWHTFHWSRSVSCWRCGKSLLCLLGCCSFRFLCLVEKMPTFCTWLTLSLYIHYSNSSLNLNAKSSSHPLLDLTTDRNHLQVSRVTLSITFDRVQADI